MQCRSCGLGRAHPGEFDVGAYYTDDYFSGGQSDGYVDYLGAEPVLRREFKQTVDFIRRFRAGGRLLELGCAYGFFLREAQPFYEVAGIEIAEGASAFCRGNGLHVLTGLADAATFAQLGMMDVIVMLDVIEHLPDPHATLALCRRHLNPGGIVVITTGDFASLHARMAGRRWRLMTPPQHLWYFTPESLRRMGQALALPMEACSHPWKTVPLSLIAFQAGRMLGLGSPGRPGMSRIGIPVNLFDAMRVILRASGS